MNRLIIIGNGFDLAHKLRTSYSDFIFDYLTMSIQTAMLNGDYEDDLISITNQNGKILQRKVNWNETNTINIIKEILEHKDTDGKIILKFKSELFRELTDNFRFFHWFEIENAYSNILLKYVKNIPEYISNNNEKNYFHRFQKMNNEFDFLKSLLISYLNKEYTKFDDNNLSDKIHEMLFKKDKLFNYNLNEDETLVLNFNYTELIEKYINRNYNKIRIKNIHGSLKNPENILFGFGDSSHESYKKMFKIQNQEALRHIKTISPYSLKIVDDTINFLESNYFQVIIAGHSCSVTDFYILSKIFNHPKCTSVRILHHTNQNSKNDFEARLFNIASHLNNPDNVHKLVNQQHLDDSF